MSQRLNDRQTMFLMSFLSELGAGLTGFSIGELLKYVVNDQFLRLESAIGRWEIIWGPAVFQLSPGGLADSVMLIARERSHSRLVVAIAGTNPNSYFDWFILDWDIRRTINWPFGNAPRSAGISRGSWIAFNILQSLRPEPRLPGAGLTIDEFLGEFLRSADRGLEIVLTGHSLGGAVSPVVMLWLEDMKQAWDPEDKAQLSCFAYAGPTTGNAAFAEYAGNKLGDRFHRLANSLDISPHGWGQAGLERSKSIYSPFIPVSADIVREVDFLKHRGRHVNYQQIDPDATPLPGKLNTSILNFAASPYQNYLVQQHYQHTEAYFELLDITQYINYQRIMRNALCPLALSSYVATRNLFEYRRFMELVLEQ